MVAQRKRTRIKKGPKIIPSNRPEKLCVYKDNAKEWLDAFKKVDGGHLTQQAAADMLGVPRNTLQARLNRWRKAGCLDSLTAPGVVDLRLRSNATFQRSILTKEEEERLVLAIFRRRRWGYVISRGSLLILAQKTFPHLATRFTKRWVRRFCKRNKLVLRKAKSCPKEWTRQEWQTTAERFWDDCDFFQQYLNLTAGQVCNFDETRVVFGDAGTVTIEKKGAKGVYVSSGGDTKRGVTVIAGVKADGSKLPLVFIFKGRQRGPRNVVIAEPHTKDISRSGWVNGQIWKRWSAKLLYSGEHINTNQPSLIVLDRYKTHMEETFIQKCNQKNIRVLFVPGGMTGALQPLDVSIFGPLKNR